MLKPGTDSLACDHCGSVIKIEDNAAPIHEYSFADALTRLPDGIVGRVAFQVLAGLLGTSAWQARELYRGAPYGVGYTVAAWRRGAAAQ